MFCKCGNANFTCVSVQKYDIEINAVSGSQTELYLASEQLEGPYICTQCGAEYETLEIKEV